MRNDHRRVLTTRTYPRRTILRTGLGAASLAAGGLLGAGAARAAHLQAGGGTLPQDAAAEQILRVQTGSSGSADFDFQTLSGAGDQGRWQSLLRLPLLYFDLDLNLQPAIFDSWQPNEDSSVWTFTIDPRAVWSDGTPITAADVKGSWELMANPILENSRVRGYIGGVVGFADVLDQAAEEAAGLVVKDERTLVAQLVEPDQIFHWRIATIHMAPVKIEQARDIPETYWMPENDPMSSGPYLLESFEPDQGTAAMVKNPNWWRGEGQFLERIEFRFLTDPGTVAIMVQNNEVDASFQALPLELQSEFPAYFQPVTSFAFHMFWLTMAEPTNDLNVRKALISAVDFESLYDAAFPLGGAPVATQLLDPDLPCLETEQTWYPYDPEAAQAALAASSYGSAENLPRLRVTPRGQNPHQNRALEAVIEFWRQNLGITNIDFREQPEAFGPEEGQINLTRDDVQTRFPDSASYLWAGTHSGGPRATETMNGYANPEVDRLIEQALLLPADDPQRCELVLEAQRHFMDEYHVLFFGIEERTLNAREYVRNYQMGPDRTLIEPWQIYLAEH